MIAHALIIATSLSAVAFAASAQRVDAPTIGIDGSLNPLHRLGMDQFKAFVDAPLFDPARELPPVVAMTSGAPLSITALEPPPSLHLLGIIHGARDLALIRRDDDLKPLTLSTGDHLGPWQVTVLPTTGIRLDDGARAYEYALFATTGTSPMLVTRTKAAPDVAASSARASYGR